MKSLRAPAIIAILIVIGMYGFISCTKKKDEVKPDETTQANEVIQDDQIAQNESDEMDNISEDLFEENGINQRINADACVTITKDGNKITFDFGTVGCKTKGRTRTGKIIVTYTGKYRNNGSIFTYTFDGYAVDGRKIEGQRTVTNKGNNTYEIQAVGMKITFPDGSSSTWSSTRTRTWDSKGTPLNLADDELKIYGTASGVNRNTVAYTATVNQNTPLTIKVSCAATDRIFYPVSGKMIVSINGKNRTIDYGTGTCDKKVTVTLAGGTSVDLDLQ